MPVAVYTISKTVDRARIMRQPVLRRDRSYATVQRLMLRTYLRRIQRFNLAVNRSLANLQVRIGDYLIWYGMDAYCIWMDGWIEGRQTDTWTNNYK